MAALALALWALFGITAVVVRVLIHLRRTGTTGVRGISGRTGSAEWLGGVAFVASIALRVAAPVLDQADAIDALDGVAAHIAGLALFGLGLAGVLWSQQALGRSWRIGVEEGELTTLVTGGPFELVRNPIYTAMMAVVLGLALLVPSVVSLVAVALMVTALELQTRLVEEPYLLRSHGEAYAAYAGRVGRFLPGIGTLPATGPSRPSPQGPAGPSRRPAP